MPTTPRMAQIEALLADDPDDAFLCYGLAMEHASAGDDATAVQHLQKLIELKRPTAEPYIPAYLQVGQLLARLSREPEAVVLLKEGIVRAKEVNDLHAMGEMQGLLSTME